MNNYSPTASGISALDSGVQPVEDLVKAVPDVATVLEATKSTGGFLHSLSPTYWFECLDGSLKV
jgi:hypothetical protein